VSPEKHAACIRANAIGRTSGSASVIFRSTTGWVVSVPAGRRRYKPARGPKLDRSQATPVPRVTCRPRPSARARARVCVCGAVNCYAGVSQASTWSAWLACFSYSKRFPERSMAKIKRAVVALGRPALRDGSNWASLGEPGELATRGDVVSMHVKYAGRQRPAHLNGGEKKNGAEENKKQNGPKTPQGEPGRSR
jgi:hypothetical protein